MKNRTVQCIVAGIIAIVFSLIFAAITTHYGVSYEYWRGASTMLVYFVLCDIFKAIYKEDV